MTYFKHEVGRLHGLGLTVLGSRGSMGALCGIYLATGWAGPMGKHG